ncbi:retention module-containing protein [Campylobacter concisus]|uniref:retention module-containing protein n=1 Tax=Campylobacter concisus TaxID=199 RepID=UPI000D3483AC|nr:retention module-containing protein [Campylobacter concisus]
MQTQVGVIKQISGLVVAVDQNGVSRVLKVGDALYLGEVVKTSSASSKAVVSMDNGKDVTILGDESLKLDENVAAGEKPNTVADVSDLQKALLNGEDLTKLEETAALVVTQPQLVVEMALALVQRRLMRAVTIQISMKISAL